MKEKSDKKTVLDTTLNDTSISNENETSVSDVIESNNLNITKASNSPNNSSRQIGRSSHVDALNNKTATVGIGSTFIFDEISEDIHVTSSTDSNNRSPKIDSGSINHDSNSGIHRNPIPRPKKYNFEELLKKYNEEGRSSTSLPLATNDSNMVISKEHVFKINKGQKPEHNKTSVKEKEIKQIISGKITGFENILL